MKNNVFFIALLSSLILSTNTSYADDNVSVVVYNNVYQGTLTHLSDDKALFTSVYPSDTEGLSIQGTWRNEHFSGACTITYNDGIVETVPFKDGIVTGVVTRTYPDSSYSSFSVKEGLKVGEMNSYSSSNELIASEWFYKSALLSSIKETSIPLDTNVLSESPYDYEDITISHSGTVCAIYATADYNYIILETDSAAPIVFRYGSLSTSKLSRSIVPALNIGDSITAYGTLSTVYTELPAVYNLYNNYNHGASLLIENEYTGKVENQDDTILASLSLPLPVFTLITCDDENLSKQSYDVSSDKLRYASYLFKHEKSIKGTIAHIDSSGKYPRLLLREDKTGYYYCISFHKPSEMPQITDDNIGQLFVANGLFYSNYKYAISNADNTISGYFEVPQIRVSDDWKITN